MGFEYLTNVPLDEARGEYLARLQENGFAGQTELVSVQNAFGRITARAVYAAICAPHYAASAMDGIAVHAKDTFGATETTPVRLTPQQYMVVDTGDPVPEDCDAVIMVEDIVRGEDESVTIYAAAAPWQHIRQIGEDICAGEMILASYMEVTPAAIGAMIAGGVLEIEVIKKPVIGIIPTGDEIVAPCTNPKPGDIIEFNSSIFSAMVQEWGAEAKTYPIVPDRFDAIREMVAGAADECDIVLLNAGSSAGREDYSVSVIRELGDVVYHGIAIKPGKPAILGLRGAVPILGVPGYPVSGIIVIEELLKPLVAEWIHSNTAPVQLATATLTRPVVSGLKYQEFVRVRMGEVGGKLTASPLSRGAGVVSSFMKADGILEVPQGTEGYEAGEEVQVRLLSTPEKLQNTLVVIGSHDPLLDEVADMMHRADPTGFHQQFSRWLYGRDHGDSPRRGACRWLSLARYRDRCVQSVLPEKIFSKRWDSSCPLCWPSAGTDACQGKSTGYKRICRYRQKWCALCQSSEGVWHARADGLSLRAICCEC